MAEIKHVEVKKLSEDKIVVSVYCRELKSWATVTFEIDDDERCQSLFCTVDIHGRGQSNKVTVAPDFAAVGKDDCTVTVWNNKNGE
jgi:hypothetical protein